jgi:hypothetical protein
VVDDLDVFLVVPHELLQLWEV